MSNDEFNEDEFSITRNKDGAVILDRLFLSKNGISPIPVFSLRGENANLAFLIRHSLDLEKNGRLAFGCRSNES